MSGAPSPTLSVSYADTGTLTVTLNNPPASGAPTSVNVQLLGQSIPVTLTNGTGSLAIVVHPSLAASNLRVAISVPASQQTTPPIGTAWAQLGSNNGPGLPAQLVAPAVSGNPYRVLPTSKAILRAYYAGLLGSQTNALMVQTAQAQDLYTIVSVLVHAMTARVLPALTATSYTPITLSANEENALKDLQTNLQPNMGQNLSTIYPSGGSRTVAYQGVIDRAPIYNDALASYETDVTTIPNLTD
jgi:hypothetical protein